MVIMPAFLAAASCCLTGAQSMAPVIPGSAPATRACSMPAAHRAGSPRPSNVVTFQPSDSPAALAPSATSWHPLAAEAHGMTQTFRGLGDLGALLGSGPPVPEAFCLMNAAASLTSELDADA